jgi:uncharacterized membrane protein
MISPESHVRSIVKGVSYRLCATLITVALGLVLTGNRRAALTIGAFELVTKVVLFWAHERLWNRVPWGVRASAGRVEHRQHAPVAMPTVDLEA